MTEAVFGLIGVLIGAGGALVKDWWSESQNRKRHARYLAVRIACILDQYVEQCAQVACDDGSYHNSDGYLEPKIKEPQPPTYPEDIDWKSISHDLMYRALALPSEAEAVSMSVMFTFTEVAFPPYYEEGFEERKFQYARLGLIASNIASDLRKSYDIPSRDLGEWWDPDQILREKKDKIEKDRASRKNKTPVVLDSSDKEKN